MHEEAIQKLIEAHIPQAQVTLMGDGRHFQVLVVSSYFEGMGLLARERAVQQSVSTYLLSGQLHALSIKTKTPLEQQSEKEEE